MYNDETLLDAVYTKIKRREPLSVQDLERWVNFLAQSQMNLISKAEDHEIAALNSRLSTVMQQKFMGQ
jgi:hypothetical protein